MDSSEIRKRPSDEEIARKQTYLDALKKIQEADNPAKEMGDYLSGLGMEGIPGQQEARFFFLYNVSKMPGTVVELMMNKVNSGKIPREYVNMSLIMTGIEQPGFSNTRE